jgi:sugar lactone lactonase YvrE
MHPMLRSEPRVFRGARSIIAESLWWNATEGAMEWCDIDAGTLHRSRVGDPTDGSGDRVVRLPPPIGAFQPARGGGYVAAALDTVLLVEAGGGESEADPQTIATIPHAHPGIRFNEAKCDPFGRFVVGSMDATNGEPDCAIYVVEPGGDWHTLIGGITVANGFEWSDDGSRMWFTDTATQTIYVGDYSEAGELTSVEPFATGLQSDGLARDAAGGFWNAINDTGRVLRWNADGTKDFEFDIPAGHVTSVGFGGPDLSTLFVATAREKLTEQQLEEQPLTGSIFAVETATHGFPVHEFGRRETK